MKLADSAARLGACLVATCALQAAHADTALERSIAAEPSPHKLPHPAGRELPAHWARYVLQLGDDASNQLRVDAMRRTVDDCARSHRESQLPVAIVKEWPARPTSVRTDVYVAADRVATYSHGVSYVVSPQDCGLIEQESRTVTVKSPSGVCRVNLLDKTASPECATTATAKPRRPDFALPAQAGTSTPGPASPLAPQLTGERRLIAGVSCDVATTPLDPSHGTSCYARGGRLRGYGPRAAADGSPLVIEAVSTQGFAYTATEAVMDMATPAALFAPQQRADIHIDKDDAE